MKNDDSRRGLEVGIDVRMERPQSEPTVWNPSAAILMVANSQGTGFPWRTGDIQHESPSICYLRLALFFLPFLPVVGEKGPRLRIFIHAGLSYTGFSLPMGSHVPYRHDPLSCLQRNAMTVEKAVQEQRLSPSLLNHHARDAWGPGPDNEQKKPREKKNYYPLNLTSGRRPSEYVRH